ncbi:hypothetical protein WN943_024775 [Citrus x changshan-huyou]
MVPSLLLHLLYFRNVSDNSQSGICLLVLPNEDSQCAFDGKIILIGCAGGLVTGLVLGFNFSTVIVGWFLDKLGMQQMATRKKGIHRN